MAEASYPTKLEEFNTYVVTVVPYLNTHKARLGVTNPNVNALNAIYSDAVGLTGWIEVYPLTTNRATSTGALRDARDVLRTSLKEKLRVIYGDVPESALTETDRNTLRIFKKDTVPSERPAIETTPYPRLFPLKGGKVKVTVRVAGDASRSSMHKDADSIEMKYTVGTSAPGSVLATENTMTYKGAVRSFDFGPENATKRLYAFFRWKNDSDDAKSGPWCDMVQCVVA